MMLRLLLENEAARVRQGVAEAKPEFSCKEDYFSYVDKLNMRKSVVNYSNSGTICLDFKN